MPPADAPQRPVTLPADAPRGPEPTVGDDPPPRRELPAEADAKVEEGDRRGAVDSAGHPTEGRDVDYTGTSPEAFERFQRGDAPLGMSPDQYQEMKVGLEDALRQDGLEDADVRMQGSAAFFYSRNPNKEFFSSPDDIRDHCEQRRADGFEVGADTEDAAVQRWEDHGYADGPRPQDKMFDQDHVVTGLPEDRSDYDIQISSDTLQTAMEQYQREHPEMEVISDHGGHWKSDPVQDRFRSLQDWATTWTERTGREVNLAGFSGDGPPGVSGFSDEDWIIRQRES